MDRKLLKEQLKGERRDHAKYKTILADMKREHRPAWAIKIVQGFSNDERRHSAQIQYVLKRLK